MAQGRDIAFAGTTSIGNPQHEIPPQAAFAPRVANAREEYIFPPEDPLVDAVTGDVFEDSYDYEAELDADLFEGFGKKFNINPFLYNNSRRNNINQVKLVTCGICSDSYPSISSHTSLCRCGGNILTCSPHTKNGCHQHKAAVWAHLGMKLSSKELQLLFNEGSDSPGTYYCNICGTDTTESWCTFQSHHVFDSVNRTYVPICTKFSFFNPSIRDHHY